MAGRLGDSSWLRHECGCYIYIYMLCKRQDLQAMSGPCLCWIFGPKPLLPLYPYKSSLTLSQGHQWQQSVLGYNAWCNAASEYIWIPPVSITSAAWHRVQLKRWTMFIMHSFRILTLLPTITASSLQSLYCIAHLKNHQAVFCSDRSRDMFTQLGPTKRVSVLPSELGEWSSQRACGFNPLTTQPKHFPSSHPQNPDWSWFILKVADFGGRLCFANNHPSNAPHLWLKTAPQVFKEGSGCLEALRQINAPSFPWACSVPQQSRHFSTTHVVQ